MCSLVAYSGQPPARVDRGRQARLRGECADGQEGERQGEAGPP